MIRFANRAKRIENKPVLNEIVNDAIEVKRMKKKIDRLQTELNQRKSEIEKYQTMQAELDFLKRYAIQPTGVKNALRRQTWNGGGQSLIPLFSVKTDAPGNVNSPVPSGIKAAVSAANLQYARGCEARESEIYDDFAGMFSIDEDCTFTTPAVHKNPPKVSMLKRSFIATPTQKSMKSIHRASGMCSFTF